MQTFFVTTGDGDTRTGFAQDLCGRPADTETPTGDENSRSFEFHSVRSLS